VKLAKQRNCSPTASRCLAANDWSVAYCQQLLLYLLTGEISLGTIVVTVVETKAESAEITNWLTNNES